MLVKQWVSTFPRARLPQDQTSTGYAEANIKYLMMLVDNLFSIFTVQFTMKLPVVVIL